MMELTEIIDEEVSLFFQTKNEVMHEYVPIIGATGFLLYSFYKSMANRAAGNTTFPSYELVRKHLGMAATTVNRYNWLLEACGLIKIVRGNARSNNVYRLLKVTPVTPELLVKLTQALQPIETDNKEWVRFKATTLESVKAWQPLHAYFKAKPAAAPKETAPAPTNDHAPHAASADLPSQAELVAYMTETFHDGKKPLSEAAAMKMIEQYGLEAVERQISWLERRDSDNPLRTLRAALKDDWNEPKPVGKAQAEVFTPAEMAMMKARMNEPNEVETEPALSLPPDDPMPVPDAIPDPAPAPESPDPDPIWQEVKERLRMQLAQATYDTWVKQTELISITGQQWLIQCDSSFAQDWLENRLNGTLTRTVRSVAGHEVELKFVIRAGVVNLPV